MSEYDQVLPGDGEAVWLPFGSGLVRRRLCATPRHVVVRQEKRILQTIASYYAKTLGVDADELYLRMTMQVLSLPPRIPCTSGTRKLSPALVAIALLRALPYRVYLNSPRWKRTRTKIRKERGEKCQLCAEPKRLNVHHNTYERLAFEDPTDLVVLCRKDHAKFHGVMP